MPEQVFQSIATREGSVEKVPVNSNDITNKNYVDNLITTLTVGTLLVTAIIVGSLIKLSEDDGVLVFNESVLINGSLQVIENVTINGTLFGGSPLKIGSDVNITTGTLYLNYFTTSISGPRMVVKRSNANGAIFGVENDIAGANTVSGAGYVTITDCGNYSVDAHSSLDTNNPSNVVHHLTGCLISEKWRLHANDSSTFNFEDDVDSSIFQINRSEVTISGANLSIEDIEVRTSSANFICIGTDGIIFSKTSACA